MTTYVPLLRFLAGGLRGYCGIKKISNMDKLYVIEECLAPGIWVLLSDRFYMTESDATNVYLKVCQSMQSIRKALKQE